jgi:hypothetical protein
VSALVTADVLFLINRSFNYFQQVLISFFSVGGNTTRTIFDIILYRQYLHCNRANKAGISKKDPISIPEDRGKGKNCNHVNKILGTLAAA